MRPNQNRFYHSLAFRVGVSIVIVEIIVLTITGIFYTSNFNAEIDRAIADRIVVPIDLLNQGALELNAVTNQDQMSKLVGESLNNALIVGINQNVFFSLNPALTGELVTDIPNVNRELAGVVPQSRVVEVGATSIIAVSPLFGADGRTVRFYVYIEASLEAANAQKAANVRVFVLGSLATVVLTSITVLIAFNVLVFRRLQTVLAGLRRVELGDLTMRLSGEKEKDELGSLQYNVNTMTSRIQDLVTTLEHRVEARTRDLKIAADVSRQITTELNRSVLLSHLVELTRSAFNLYHVNLYVLDSESSILKLEAATGEAGARLIGENRQFLLDSTSGMVPLAAREGKPKVSNNVADDLSHLPNPLLPDTRSEACLPAIFAGELIGVLDLQSDQPNRFTEADLVIFQTLAEQVAVALHNANLFAEVQAARERAENADKVKSAFLASVSHELRTPLNAIINFARFIERGLMGEVNQQQTELLNDIVFNGEHLLGLINDVLDISKIASGALKLFVEDNVNIQSILAVVINNATALIGTRPVNLVVVVPETLPTVRCDRQRVLQILLNIISNACKFTKEGRIEIEARIDDVNLLFAIKDTGPGIEADDYNAVFESFKQTRSGLRQGTGTGLGMPISKSLAEAHGGRVWFESIVGTGTTFYVSLPIRSDRLVPNL